MQKRTQIFLSSLLTVLLILAAFLNAEASSHGNASIAEHLVQKHERKRLVQTEYGEISAVKLSDGTRGPYHLQFITLEPNSLFLPVLLHADMVFYVHTGSGTLSWTDDNEITKVNIRKGDIYRLNPGSVFYIQSSLEPEREKLRIHAIFSNTEDNIYEASIGAYSSISDLVTGFDSKVLQATFKVPEDVIEEMLKATRPPAIIHAVEEKKKKIFCEWQARLLKAFLGSKDGFDSFNGKKKKKTKAYNVLEADPDFKNCNGWSLTVDKRDSHLLSDSNIGVFVVNLTKGSMMGPHWNPRASEIAIVLQGQGMIRVAGSSNANESECKKLRFRVKEGDVFAVPRFHPMAQLSFNNDSFVFMGFSTSTKRNYPQFLAGKSSVLTVLDRQILALSFNVTNATIDQLLTPQEKSVILDCTSCAEEEESIMEEEIERDRKEQEERRKEEEEARKKEEEEERKRQEEEARKREEEEARKRKEEEAKKREEEEARKREEEERKRREEEARKEQEEARTEEEERQRRARQEEEESRRKEKEEQEEKKKKEKEREPEEPKRRKGEKERQEGRRKREEAAAREQEVAKKEEQERQRRAEQEKEEARREREKQGERQEKRETKEGSEHGQRRVSKTVWEI